MPAAVVRKAKFFKEDDGSEPVKDWLKEMKRKKKFVEVQRINTRIGRAELGNFGDHRILEGAFGELKIDYGPGYRVYFGLEGEELIILLSGGTKNDQQGDIDLAKSRWERYLGSKVKEESDGK